MSGSRGRAAAALAAAVMALLVACTGSSGDERSVGGGTDSSGGGAGAPAPGLPEGAPLDPVDAERQVVTTASAFLVVEDPAAGAQRVSELVEDAGGRVEERSEQAAPGDDGTRGTVADLVVRVPAEELTGVLADLDELGDLASVSVSRSDVTATAVDLDARISALSTSVTRLQTLMDSAATTDALLAAESALSERQAELESLQSQRTLLADQVELSTLSVHLEPFGVSPAGGPDGFLDGLGTGWRALGSALGTLLVVLGISLPWLVLAVVVTGAVLLPLRAARRRAAAPAPAPAPAGPPPD